MTRTTRTTQRLLWTAQVLLAGLFLFAGGAKLAMPIDVLSQGPLPGSFLRFIAIAEVLGAIGLVLPALLRIKPALTPLAAAGLVIIMVGAVVLSAADLGAAASIVPFLAGAIAAFVAYGRWRLLPIAARG
jgi:hypothetical protein